MKRKCLNKILSMALVGTMVMGMAACGNTNNTESAAGTEKETTVQESTETTAATETEVAEELTYPLEGATKLSLWTSQPALASVYTSYTESPYHMGLQENTGVEVEWIYPAKGSTTKEAYNLLLTDEVLPHMIGNGTSLADAQLLAQDGMIWDLTDYIPEYAPDYWEYLNSNPELLASAKSDDGRIYGVKAYLENDYNKTYVGPVIRQDWLDECGLKAPVTLEDLEAVLVAFNEKYGAKLGFAMSRFKAAGFASGTGAFAGLQANWYVENGEVKLANMDDEWKEYLQTLNKWYDMGLIDQDSFTMDDKAVRAKVLNNEIGVSVTAMSQLTNWIADANSGATGADWVGMEYPRVAENEPTGWIQTQAQTANFVTMITTTCSEEEMITALKWLNYGFTEEGRMYTNYGTENETYTLDANGKPQWTEAITADADGMSVAITKYTGASGTPMGTIQAAHMVQIKNDEKSAAAVNVWIKNTVVGEHFFPTNAVSRTDAEAIVYSDVYTPISSRISEIALKFILGEESFDNWDAYIKELEDMGVADVIKVMQDSYDRYLAR